MKKKKILYLLHIDWDWIKQRPQFIAEGLAEKYELTCVYPLSWRFGKKTKNHNNTVKLIPVLQVPFNKIKFISSLNRLISKTVVKLVAILGGYDVIIVPSPWLYSSWMAKKSVVYDCMDNYKAFMNEEKKAIFVRKERDIVNASKIVLASSKYIINELVKDYGADRNRIKLVRNGYFPKKVNTEGHSDVQTSGVFRISYIGTIASWFDFDVILKSLDVFENIEYHLAGPIDASISLPNHPRIIYDGLIKHDLLHDYVAKFDCLMMPFVVNDIVAAVDPVKLYEYVDFNKNIICVYYDEIDRFGKFVHFYNSQEEFQQVIRQLLTCNKLKYSLGERESFLVENQWAQRVQTIDRIIRSELG
ncbi:hypothetical protein MR781_08505 [bacterium]|nr:hypothetical protein [bacterium]MDY4503931.1 hypothetical protein [Bariatricus sp.]